MSEARGLNTVIVDALRVGSGNEWAIPPSPLGMVSHGRHANLNGNYYGEKQGAGTVIDFLSFPRKTGVLS